MSGPPQDGGARMALATVEELYLAVREREGRRLTIEQISRLPEPPAGGRESEWRARAWSVARLERHLASRPPARVLDLGCGTGWLAARLGRHLAARAVGLDAFAPELAQAREAFGELDNVTFLQGDVYDDALLAPRSFDLVVAASVVQYFPDLPRLIRRLRQLVAPGGEVVVMDSPLWFARDVPAARARTELHFQTLGFPQMARHYTNHSRDDLAPFAPRYLHDPTWTSARLLRKSGLGAPTPFPMVSIAP